MKRGALLRDLLVKWDNQVCHRNMPAGYVALLPPVDQTRYSTYTEV